MSFKDKPSVGLPLYNFRELHGTHQYNHRHDTHAYRQFITDNLCTASHGTDQRKLIITTPAGKQNTYYTDTGSCQQEEYAHIKIQNFRSFIKRNTSESEERGDNHHEWSQIVEEAVGILRSENLLGQHLEYVAYHLNRTPFTDTVRTETALEETTDFTFHVN